MCIRDSAGNLPGALNRTKRDLQAAPSQLSVGRQPLPEQDLGHDLLRVTIKVHLLASRGREKGFTGQVSFERKETLPLAVKLRDSTLAVHHNHAVLNIILNSLE